MPRLLAACSALAVLAFFGNGGGQSSPANGSPQRTPEFVPQTVTVYDCNPGHLWNHLYAALYGSMATFLANEKPVTDHRADSLEKDEPQAVYAADPNDSWNRIFYCLFTRTIKTRLSDDFQEGGPFDTGQVNGFPKLLISRRVFERIESGDRAIEPLYPMFISRRPLRLLTEPHYSMFKKALKDALGEKTQRPPLARALMQSDVWAAHDLLHNFEGQKDANLLKQVMPLLAQFIKKLSLSEDEIKALPDNYARGRAAHHLPDFFGGENGWVEIRWGKERFHDAAADYRRASRVFIKPAAPPLDKIAFLNGLRQADNLTDRLDATALVTQSLLIDNKGKMVPTPLTYDVQMRTFVKDRDNKFVRAEAKQFELSRRLLLDDLKTGGFVARDEQSPIYLASAYNDYTFASEVRTRQFSEPILVRLKTRCAGCHSTTGVLTFGPVQRNASLPSVSLLKPSGNDQARYVIEKKLDRKDFKELQRRWKAGALTTHQLGTWYSAGDIALLGTMSDEALARQLGRTTSAVSQNRTKPGSSTFRDRRTRCTIRGAGG